MKELKNNIQESLISKTDIRESLVNGNAKPEKPIPAEYVLNNKENGHDDVLDAAFYNTDGFDDFGSLEDFTKWADTFREYLIKNYKSAIKLLIKDDMFYNVDTIYKMLALVADPGITYDCN